MKYPEKEPFSIERHKKTYFFYLEIIIDRDGDAHYAYPSHQEWLVHRLCEDRHMTRDEVEKACPKEFYFDYMRWLLRETGCVSVWYEFCVACGKINAAQRKTLEACLEAGIYAGKIPD